MTSECVLQVVLDFLPLSMAVASTFLRMRRLRVRVGAPEAFVAGITLHFDGSSDGI